MPPAQKPKPDGQLYAQPSSRSFTTNWTPSTIRSAKTVSDSGLLRPAADLCDALISDDRIGGVLETRIGGLLGLPLTFEASGDGRRKGRARRALEAGEDWFDAFPETELGKILKWGLLLGVAFGQLRWGLKDPTDPSSRVIPRIEFWHPRHCRWDWKERAWFTKVSDSADEVKIEPGDGRWLVFEPYGQERPWASGLWRGLALWWLLKQYAIGDWGRHGENASKLVATSPEKSTRELRRELASDLFDSGRDAVVVLPPGFDAKLIEATANTRDIYQAQIDTANTSAAVAVLGQNLTTEVKGGSYAAAQVHGRVEGQRVKADGERVSTTMRAQALVWWAEFNFGDRRLAPWPVFDTSPPEDAVQTATVAKTRAEAFGSMKSSGVKIDAEAWFVRGEIEIVEVTEPPPPPPPPQNPPPPPPGDTESDDDEPNDKSGTDDKPAQQRGAGPRLASGFEPRSAAGFLEGQTYADALADRGRQRGAEALDPFVQGVLELVDGIDDLEGARERLIRFYDDALPPEELAARSERLFVLAQLAGVTAVRQDTPEIDQ